MGRFLEILPCFFFSLTLVVGLLFATALTIEKAAAPEEQWYCGVTDSGTSGYVVITRNRTGKDIFENSCTSCHSFNEVLVGPALGGVSERRSRAWLHQFISNSTKMIEEKDSTAIALYKQYGEIKMPSFDLSPAKIDSVLDYLQESQVLY